MCVFITCRDKCYCTGINSKMQVLKKPILEKVDQVFDYLMLAEGE